MVAFATVLLLSDDARRSGLAAEALALLMAARAGDGRAARLGNLLFLLVALETLREMGLGASPLSSALVQCCSASATRSPHCGARRRQTTATDDKAASQTTAPRKTDTVADKTLCP